MDRPDHAKQASAAPPSEPDQPDNDPDIHVVEHPSAQLLGGGYATIVDNNAFIVIDPDLTGPQRQWVIAHESTHLRRGILTTSADMPPTWNAVIRKEEHLVDLDVAHKLVDPAELRSVVTTLLAAGEPVTPATVAAELGVAEPLATLALRQLFQQGPVFEQHPEPTDPTSSPTEPCGEPTDSGVQTAHEP